MALTTDHATTAMSATGGRVPEGELARQALARPLRLVTLINLRWLAIAGQMVSVLVVHFGLGFTTPLLPCVALIGLSVLLNVSLQISDAGERLLPRVAGIQLAYDCLQLGALLALTGGLSNPFSLLLLAPVSVSATTLPQRATVMLALLVIVLASLLSVVHLPLPWDPRSPLVLERTYVIGIWVSLVCGVVFIAGYTNQVAHEARQLADALTATELALSRHEQLSALDGLAAAAAHELGTPLSTIALAAKEMRSDVGPGPLADDLDLIIAQSARCGAILAKLRNLGADAGDPFASVPLLDLLAEVARPHEGAGVLIAITPVGESVIPVIGRTVGLLYGLGNLIENAVQFAQNTVAVEAGWSEEKVTVTITDDGPGYPPELIARLGEPYLTTRARSGGDEGGGGLGLGIFIAKTLLERTGARLAFSNESGNRHARVEIVWPRRAIESKT